MEKAPSLNYSSSPEKSTSCFSILKSLRISNRITLPPDEEEELYYSSDDENYKSLQIYKSGSNNIQFDSSSRLYKLRQHMLEHGIGVYIIPSEDEHQSEYTAEADKRREFISGFTGSAGIAIVTLTNSKTLTGEAALSTDGRYFLQAGKQLDSNWYLLKYGVSSYPTWQEWVIEKAKKNNFSSKISVDPKLLSKYNGEFLARKAEENDVEFEPLRVNLIDKIWRDRPTRSPSPVYQLPMKYAGENSNSKINRIRQILIAKNCTATIVTALDDIAWLLNLRADDVPYNPVFFAYIIITLNDIVLYIDSSKLNEDSISYLSTIDGFSSKDYFSIWGDLTSDVFRPVETDIMLPLSVSYAIVSSIPTERIQYKSIIEEVKSIKNETELKNSRLAQLKDGIALTRFFAWLEYKLIVKKETIDEIQAANKNFYYRSLLQNFRGLSFETISSSGSNASIIHYSPTLDDFAIINPNKIYLCDSGAQFLEGTTDITRTFHFTKPTTEEIKTYTLVLKGHIAVATELFPTNINGMSLDVLARTPLWKEGLDYRHGTGHGVGSFLNVHEGPIGIGSKSSLPLKPGNIISDEPGYYKDGEFGVRIESELEIVNSGAFFNEQEFLKFDYITRVPFCQKLINKKLLSSDEIQWINNYHKLVRNDILPHLKQTGDRRSVAWLLRETNPI